MSQQQQENDGGDGGGGAGENAYIKLQQNEQIRKTIQEISQLMNTGLSPEALDICIKLCEAGVHPQALAEVVNQIRKETSTLERQSN